MPVEAEAGSNRWTTCSTDWTGRMRRTADGNGSVRGIGAESEADRAGAAYERLLARRPDAYADHAAAFYMSIGNRAERAVDLATANWQLRDARRSRSLVARALKNARQAATMQKAAA